MENEVSSKLVMQKSILEQMVQLLTVNACLSSVRIRKQKHECKIDWTENVSGGVSSVASQASSINQKEHDEWRDVLKNDDNVLKNHRSLVGSAIKPLGPKDIRIEMDDEPEMDRPSPKNSLASLSGTDVFRRCDGLCNRVLPKKKLKSFVPCCHMICDECSFKHFGDDNGASNCCNTDCIVQKMIDRLSDNELKITLFQKLSDSNPEYEVILSQLLKQEERMDFRALSPLPSVDWSGINAGKSVVTLAKEKMSVNPTTRKKLPFDEAALRSRGYVNRQCERFHPVEGNASPKQVSVYEDYGIRSSGCLASPFRSASPVNLRTGRTAKASSSCFPKSCLRGIR